MTTEYRIRELELGHEDLQARLAELERRTAAPRTHTLDRPRVQAPPDPVTKAVEPREPTPTPAPPPPAPRPPRQSGPSFEALLGGRVLALVGAFAIVLAGAFFFALAVSSGWIGEAARTGLAAAASTALLGLGVWLHERRGHTFSSLSIAGAGLACLFLAVTVAAVVYELIPAPVALALALLVGATGTALAVRWTAAPIGAVGILGALLSPVLAGAPATGTTLALLFVANAAAVGVLVWQRWDWLACASYLVAGPQWIAWVVDSASASGALLALTAFGVLGIGAAVGFELRVPAARLRPSSAVLLALNALALAGAGWAGLAGYGEHTLAELWLCVGAAAHLAVGLWGTRSERMSQEISLLFGVIGVVVADIAFAAIVSGVVLAFGYAAVGVVFAGLLRRDRGTLANHVISIGLGAHLLLALSHVLAVDAPLAALAGAPVDLVSAVVALVALSGALFSAARLVARRRQDYRLVLDSLALVALAYAAVLALSGAMLVATFAVAALVLAFVACRTRDRLALGAATGFLGAALAQTLASEAPPDALIYGVEAPLAAFVSIGVCAGVALASAAMRLGDRTWQLVLWASGGVSLLYLASVAIVTAFQPGAAETAVLELPVRQQGQVLVSALWGLAGLGALLAGLRGDRHELRIGALALLFATIAKVFLYDLAALGSVYRVLSFLALGALLLAASFAYQRLRPMPLPDLREVARGLR